MINWKFKAFDELTVHEFHDVIALRLKVFVVEQNCPYQDLDEKDKVAIHVFGLNEKDKVVAVARILPKGVSYPEISIGRVVTDQTIRLNKIGIKLMEECMLYIQRNFPNESVRISAQSHLEKFYNKFGFVSTGKHYLEDNIPHTEMLYHSD